jgi:hypothetical protein
MENKELLGEKLYVYQHRIDASHDKGKEIVDHCRSHDECKYYLFAKEKKSCGMNHFQGIVFLTKPLATSNERMKWSNVKTRKWVYTHKNSVSFTIAKNPRNLAKYCNDKEHLGIITNLSSDQLERIGKWQSIQQIKMTKRQKDDQALKEKMSTMIDKFDNPNYICYQQIYELLADAAYDVYVRPPPMRSLVLICKSVIPKRVFNQCLYRELQR